MNELESLRSCEKGVSARAECKREECTYVPRAHDKSHKGGNVATATNGDEAREECGQIATGGNRVGSDVRAELGAVEDGVSCVLGFV